MKLRWKIMIGLVAVGVIGGYFLLRPEDSAQGAVEETRRALRQEGFKTDLSEFNFFTSAELRAREAALTNAVFLGRPANRDDYARLAALREDEPNLMTVVGSNAAVVVWKQARLLDHSGADLWPALREAMSENRAELDAACAAALSGPIRFDLNASHGSAMLLRHCAALKTLSQILGKRAVLELRDQARDAAWTNLLAVTRLVTAWDPEPTDVSHLVRFACAGIAYNLTWQTLQAEGWTDSQLARLQAEWESVDFLKGLPETVAFSRASAVASCQFERQQPLSSFGLSLKEFFRSPRETWGYLRLYLSQSRYLRRGSYEDEQALLLYYRDREVQMRRAVQSQAWSDMRQLPGVTNFIPFRSKYPSRIQSMLNLRQNALAMQLYSSGGNAGAGLLGRAANAEARRRLLTTAIALERFRGRHGAYPKTLPELTPDFLKLSPVDFMDGQPLRYRPADDGHFVLYSVGPDGADDGGKLKPEGRSGALREAGGLVQPGNERFAGRRGTLGFEYGSPHAADLVWPRPATAADVERLRQEQLRALEESRHQNEELQADEQWQRTARRQARVESILSTKPTSAKTTTHQGRPLNEVLANQTNLGTNKPTLNELLTLTQVLTGEEPEIVTFEAPIAYDILTNLGSLVLFIDPVEDDDSDEGCQAGWSECQRAANGNCRLVWNTIYESPGKHALQMGLDLNEPTNRDEDFCLGPIMPFVVSNLCQFSLASAHFNPEMGATLHARLPEPNGTYTIRLKAPDDSLVRTFVGTTSNGVIKVHWDLTDELGRRCTNQSFASLFHIALRDSGRTQILKGP